MTNKKLTVIASTCLLFLGVAGYVIDSSNAVRKELAIPKPAIEPLNETCHEPTSQEDMKSAQICTYNTTNFEAVYQQIRNQYVAPEVKLLLRENMPTQAAEDIFKDAYAMSATYKYNSQGNLLVTVSFEGGVDDYEFTHQKNQAVVTMTNSAD